MLATFSERVAVVTGATGGIGQSIAMCLANAGAMVAVGFLQNRTAADEIVASIGRAGGTAVPVQFDIADTQSFRHELDGFAERYEKIDILVNNAGVLPRPSSWQSINDAAWQRSLDVNLRGTFNCITWARPYLAKSQHASIINMASTTGAIVAAPGAVAYGAAKAGVVSLTRTMAKALAPTIRVNAICPGFIDTGMSHSSSPEFLTAQRAKTLLGRLGTAEEVADVVAFLASDAARYITGQVLIVDGGHSVS